MMRMRFRSLGVKIPIRTLLADPFQERFQQRRITQRFDAVISARQIRVPERRVHLLMTRLAKRRAMLGLATLLPGFEMVLRDQPRRHFALAKLAGNPLVVVVPRRRMMILDAARHAQKW
jgi:hypothetical protein